MRDAYTSAKRPGATVPAMIALVARDTFKIGITAVVELRLIPGINPMNAGTITTIIIGLMIL